MASKERNRTDPERPHVDPRLRVVDGEQGMPAEFIDTPENQPGDHSPPSPENV